MSKTRIEIIAVGECAVYSIGAVEMTEKGEVYLIHKGSGSHISRHASGVTHTRLPDGSKYLIRNGPPIHDFRGIEFLATLAYGLESLPEIHREYRMQKCDGIFAVDMRAYRDSAFNMAIALVTDEGLDSLFEMWKAFGKGQLYMYTDIHPMIAIKIGDAADIRPEKL